MSTHKLLLQKAAHVGENQLLRLGLHFYNYFSRCCLAGCRAFLLWMVDMGSESTGGGPKLGGVTGPRGAEV